MNAGFGIICSVLEKSMAQKFLKRKPHKVTPTDAGNRKRIPRAKRVAEGDALAGVGTGDGRYPPAEGCPRSGCPSRGAVAPRTPSAVLVGTYKEGQLAWIKRHGIYNYPVKEEDFSRVERVDRVEGERGTGNGERGTVGIPQPKAVREADALAGVRDDPIAPLARVKELWLYADTKGTRHVFEAEFVGIKTRDELVDEYSYPSSGAFNAETQRRRGGRAGAHPALSPLRGSLRSEDMRTPHGSSYYVFKTKYLEYGTRIDDPFVIARAADFGGRSAKVKKAIEQFKADGEFAPLEHYLPSDLAKVPRNRLRVCEAAAQYYFWDMPNMKDQKPTVPFPPPKYPKFTFIDLFAGIGGFRLAMQAHGGECVFSSEWDAKAQETYSANFGDVPYGDITKKETKNAIPDKIDVVCAGFPCQAFSMAGKRMGFDDNYKGMCRGTLFREVVEICEKHKPKVAFCENVKGLLIHDKGRTLKVIKGAFEEIGYHFYYTVLNSKDFGVPQHRERLYMIALRNDIVARLSGGNEKWTFPFPKPTGESVTLQSIREYDVPARYYLSTTYVETLRRHKAHHEALGHGFGYQIRDWSGTSGAIVCGGMGREGNLVIDKTDRKLVPETHIKGTINTEGIRKMTPREWARLQGFPEDFRFVLSDVHLYKQFGNSVTIPVIKAIANEIEKEVCNDQFESQ